MLRRLVEDSEVCLLAREGGVGQATGYGYLHEAIDLFAARTPDLTEIPDAGPAGCSWLGTEP